jgi:invasion protein IalB
VKLSRALIGGLVLAVAGVCAASAQDAPSGPPPKPDVKTVDDWQVRCYAIQSISPCDIFQEQADQRSNQRVLSISIAYVPSMDRHVIQVTVPLDVAIQNGLVMQSDSYTSPALKYRM